MKSPPRRCTPFLPPLLTCRRNTNASCATSPCALPGQHPLFILVTLIAKLRIVLFLLLCWSNGGLLAAAFYPKGWATESAFWSALIFSSLFGIVAIPQVQYLLGFMAFATLYGIVSMDYALERRRSGELHPG